MVADVKAGVWYELFRACPAIPLAQDGTEMDPAQLPIAMEISIVEERGESVVVESRGSTPAQPWRYLVQRADLERAVTSPEELPREGQAPTASSNTAGSPD
jgi:hypothetical protein